MLSKTLFITVLATLLLGSSAYFSLPTDTAYCQANVCRSDGAGGCTGVCPPLYDGNGGEAGNPVCELVGGVCKCTHLDLASNNCTVRGGRCRGNCDKLYRSKDDATHKRNPMKGDCVDTDPTARVSCACRYKL